MSETTRPNILFVINPRSGSQKKDYTALIHNHCHRAKWVPHVCTINEQFTTSLLSEQIASLSPHMVVAVGGDGTVSLVAGVLLHTSIPLGIIPGGSANGMARELNIPTDPEDALALLCAGVPRRIDVLFINKRLCIHLADVGLNARLIKYFQKEGIRGHWGYFKVALRIFWEKKNMRVIIRADGKTIRRKALMVVLANASKYGTGAVVNPIGDLADGLFEVVIIKQMGLITLLKMWFNPKTLMPSHAEVLQAQEVHINTIKQIHFQIDGEYVGKESNVHAYIVPSCLTIISPPETG